MVAEALTNVAKHSRATQVDLTVVVRNDRLVIEIHDDGDGGADASRGNGLSGLSDRVTALGGRMQVVSPTGGPTSVTVEIPCGS